MSQERTLPLGYRVVSRAIETQDTATLTLQPIAGVPESQFAPGQFMMLYAHGVGEVAISVSGDPSVKDGTLVHTIRDVGAVSRALHDAPLGTIIGVRGPFGRGWNLPASTDRDLVIVAGGVGLAPLRPVVLAALAAPECFRRVTLVVGARSPADILYRTELETWQARADLAVELTIDQPVAGWTGGVGFVTESLHRIDVDPERTTALLCGPEPMMRFCARALTDRGVDPRDIQVSVERNMQCGAGLCGHCQLGELLLCRDGPVVDYAVAEPLLRIPEL
ncbi:MULTISPECIES: FAD/NAD(P)-binding protein [unclassified Rhodococcus (in: high G+C Gram-positive bacteria)]|uniref:FAD/NAD(P)-binding protein n=1 Tax=unclassified Rhodococcus (in: high G+C Gram-positive bacteria) TaxID=192944 RepID=UPI000307F661|nr:FAD/NAD(P)-binding protein [Rhodococcus sp. DK17]